jgi:hypothetical protein
MLNHPYLFENTTMHSKLALSLVLFCSCSTVAIGTQAVAQTSSDLQSPQQPQTIFQQDNPDDASNVFTDRATGTSLLNLLNRLQQASGRSSGEFAEEQTESFNEAVDAFRQQQQQKIGGQQEATPEPPKPTEP